MRDFPALARLLACTSLALITVAAFSQQPTDADKEEFEQLSKGNLGQGGFGGTQVTISPDGKMVGWVGKSIDGKGDRGIWVMPIAGGAPHQVYGNAGSEKSMIWSPDSKSIAFIGDARDENGPPQLFIAPADTGVGKQLTTFPGSIQSPQFSPDGKYIAFLGIKDPSRVAGATQPFKPQTGIVGSKSDVQHIYTVDVSSGRTLVQTRPDVYIYEFCWSPTNNAFAFTAAAPPGENNWWTAKLYVEDFGAGGMSDQTLIPDSLTVAVPDLQINRPRWSPDGKWIAYIGGLMSDFGSVGGDVYIVPADGGKPKDIAPGMKATADSITWTKDNKIVVGENIDGDSAFVLLDPMTGNMRQLDREAATFSGPDGNDTAAISADEKMEAFAKNTIDHNTEIFAGPPGQAKQITHWSDDEKPDWGKVESLHWKSDKFDVQGYLVWPANVEPGKKYPMIVNVHGGPAGSYSAGWNTGARQSFWSRAGYFVFLPNPRGSFGEGEEFTKANRKDFGYGDFRDIMRGVDEAIRVAPVDPNRLGLTGGSYGGYMTMWGVTQTHRFKAAVATAGIANWKSYYGENSIDEWMIPFFGASVYDDPAVYAKSSPIEFIKNVRTPTMIAVGEFDGECPPPQSYEFWHALTTLGVPTELLVYPGEGHGIRSPENLRDFNLRKLAWFNFYLGH